MAYKTVLVHVDAGARCRARVEVAIRVARQFEAHLIGLNALTRTELPGYVLAGAGGMPIVEIQRRLVDEQASRAETMFRNAAATAGFAAAEWRSSDLDAVEAVMLHGRYADLIVLGQPGASDDSGVQSGFAEHVVLEAGRPVLMVPHSGSFATLARRILIGWNASREAARAVTDAIPFLRQAESVEVLTINPSTDAHGVLPGGDIAVYLARHGVRVEVNVDSAVEIDDGAEILSRTADFGADLIVMGAYGHSRFRELVMGGASRTLLNSMTVPVLLSH